METVEKILEDIIRIANPCRVILYGKKLHVASEMLKSLDFCIVTTESSKDVQRKLCLGIDYDLPTNFKVYEKSDWDVLMSDEESYAYLIAQKGTVLYER